jgi:hypothetical protein
MKRNDNVFGFAVRLAIILVAALAAVKLLG